MRRARARVLMKREESVRSITARSYDAETDSYRCPQGKTLSYEGKEQRHTQVSYRYRAQRSDCQGCPVKSQCCPGNRVTGRSVHRSEEIAEVAEFRPKMQSEQAREIYRPR